MPPTLTGVFERLNRAEQHLDALKDKWIAQDPSTPIDHLVRQPYFNRGHLHSETFVFAPEPIDSIWLGEVLHDARSSLDNLAYQLVFKHPVQVTTQLAKLSAKKFYRMIAFPVFDDLAEFLTNHKVKWLRDWILDPDEFAAIQESQPCERNKTDPADDALSILSSLNNIDKHRSILEVDKRYRFTGQVGDVEIERNISVVKSGTNVFSLPVDESDAHVTVNKATSTVFFNSTGTRADGRTVIDETRRLITEVRNLVTDKFKRFFP